MLVSMVLATGASAAFLTLLFVPLERVFAARRQPMMRPGLGLDVAFFLGQHLVWNGLAVLLLRHGAPFLSLPASSLPPVAQAVLAVVAGDLLVYGFHRACHRVDFLWRIHAVHHSSEHLDFVAAHREHPLDGLLTQLCQNLPAMLLGFSVQSIAGLVAFRGIWAVLVHANVRLPLGPLRYLVGAPELHHWHHARVTETRHNFANLAPWIDVLFGTHHEPPSADYALGIPDEPRRDYLGYLLAPFTAPKPRQ